MHKSNKISVEHWVNLIAQKELPAIASTVKVLEKFSNDDKSSLPMLSKSILHDQALASCLLKVANGSHRFGQPKITTVSRATVVLGIQAVKNICLTATVIDALFESKRLTPYSYQKLSELMARSFYAGVIAKALVNDYSEETQEEVYVAAMMYSIGETAFWSSGGRDAEQLRKAIDCGRYDEDEAIQHVLGCSFNNISIGLAKVWGLGSLVEKALDNPEQRTPEIQIIYLANKLSEYIMSPPEDAQTLLELLTTISDIKNITIAELRHRLASCREAAIELLSSYGASILEDNIKPLPTIDDLGKNRSTKKRLSQEMLLIEAVKKLSKLTRKSHDINDYFQLTLTNLVDTFLFDNVALFIFTQDKKSLKVRLNQSFLDKYNHKIDNISLQTQPNVISYMVETNHHLEIKNPAEKKWLNYISSDLDELISFGPSYLMLVEINQKPIGLIACQYVQGNALADDKIFENICFLVEHLNMCLSLVSK